MTQTVLIAYSIPLLDSEWPSWEDEIIEVQLSNTKYAQQIFPVTVNQQ